MTAADTTLHRSRQRVWLVSLGKATLGPVNSNVIPLIVTFQPMNATLDSLIARFRAAQDIAVRTLTESLSIPRPSSGLDWVHYCAEHGLHKLNKLGDVGIYAHGYGIELKIADLTIDFDWGDNGEPDGFDGWRLWKFEDDNGDDAPFSHSDVNAWLDEAYNQGELTKCGALYFDPNRRSANSTKTENAG